MCLCVCVHQPRSLSVTWRRGEEREKVARPGPFILQAAISPLMTGSWLGFLRSTPGEHDLQDRVQEILRDCKLETPETDEKRNQTNT